MRPEADGSIAEALGLAINQVIVFISGNSDSETDQLLKNEASENEFLQVIRVTKQQPGSARNLGIEARGGEWVLFLDDDACIPAGGIRAITEVNWASRECGRRGWSESYAFGSHKLST